MPITSLDDIEAFEAVPSTDRWRGDNTYDVIARTAERQPSAPALKFQNTASIEEEPLVLSYEVFLQKINQTANALHDAGVALGGVTSVVMPNLPETHYALWGAQALGIVSPINHMLGAEALRDIMIESAAQALVVLGATPGEDMWEKVAGVASQVPTLKVIFRVNLSEPADGIESIGDVPVRDFARTLSQSEPTKLTFEREIQATDVASYFHTGGTTGTPKLAQLTHANQVHVASMMTDYRSMSAETSTFGGLPLFHVNAFFNAGLTIFAAGGHVIYLTRSGFRNKEVMANYWDLVEKYRPSFLMTVPTMVSGLLDSLEPDTDLSSIEYFVCGAAPISPELFRRYMDKTGINIIEAYGLTEGTVTSSANPQHGEKRVGSIGLRTPYQQMKCVILDDDGRLVRDCEIDEPGVIVIQGPNVFKGYKQSEKNEGAFIDDWFITGDLARQDAQGYFWMTGRAKDLIIRGGHNIDPKIIEDAFAGHPAVDLAAAVGQPDAYAGELPCLYITLAEGVSDVDLNELAQFGRDHISERAANPVHIEALEEMPLTAVGKIFKPTLRERSTERVIKEAISNLASNVDVEVLTDPARGLVVKIDTKGAIQLVESFSKVLAEFALSYEVA